jgi:hypothetical protein
MTFFRPTEYINERTSMDEYAVACTGFQKPFQNTHTHTRYLSRAAVHSVSLRALIRYCQRSELHTQEAPSVNNTTD